MRSNGSAQSRSIQRNNNDSSPDVRRRTLLALAAEVVTEKETLCVHATGVGERANDLLTAHLIS